MLQFGGFGATKKLGFLSDVVFCFIRRQAGAFKPKDAPQSPMNYCRGYKLRDTDDRLSRLKTQPDQQPNGVTVPASNGGLPSWLFVDT